MHPDLLYYTLIAESLDRLKSQVAPMLTIRIAAENWARVWSALVASGPVSRIDEEPVYLVSEQQVRLLRRKKLPFEIVPASNGQKTDRQHG